MTSIVVAEYDFLVCQKKTSSDHEVTQSCFDELTALIEETPNNDDIDHGSIFWQRGKRLQIRHYVGVIQTSDGTQIEILPKIAKQHGTELNEDNIKNLRGIVLKMLREVSDLPYKSGQQADLGAEKFSLLEIFIRDFLNDVQQLVKRGIRSDYVRQTDNLPFLKGKLLMASQLKYNLIRRDRFYVENDSFEPNRPENRLLKSALNKVLKLCREFTNQRLTRELLFMFDEIPLSSNYRQDFQQCSKDRGMHYYQNSLMWCRLILNEESPVPQAGERLFRSFLFPMPILFERYVASLCQRHLQGWNVRRQVRSKNLLAFANNGQSQMFEIKPDLLFERNNQIIIADTKWKLIDMTGQARNYGITQTDLYQLFTYAKYYNASRVILIYPETAQFNGRIEFEYIENNNLIPNQNCTLELWPMALADNDGSIQKIKGFLDTFNHSLDCSDQ
jgi:5-methylcytosine-specific restriction enzyme subunit McrC